MLLLNYYDVIVYSITETVDIASRW